MNAFRALLRNDIGFNIGQIRRKYKYFWLYAAIAVMVWLFQYALTLANTDKFTIDPRYAVFVILPAFFIFSGVVISREWRGDTVGWWLSMPYSRAKLLTAKAAASFIRLILMVFMIIVVMILLFLGLLLMRPDLVTATVVSTYTAQSLQLLAWLLIFSPFIVASGMIFRLVVHSKWKVATPLFWLGIPAAFCYLISLFVGSGQGDQTFMDALCRIWSNGFSGFLLFLLAEAVFTFILYLLSVYLLKKKIEL